MAIYFRTLDNEKMKKAYSYFTCILGYYVFGKLCLLLAIPPGYSSPIWVPIGFACACIFVYGSRIAILSTFVGSFLINLQHTSPLLKTAYLDSFLLPLAIATGSSLAVWQGAYFIRRFGRISRPSNLPLHSEKKSILLLFFLGVFCSLISSLIGTSALVFFKLVEIDFFFISWAHWWVGDGIGIILVAPIGLMWARHQGPRTWQKLFQYSLPAMAVLICLTLIFKVSGNHEAKSFEENFYRNSERLVQNIQEDLKLDIEMLNSLVSFYQGSEKVEENEFHDFLKNIFTSHRHMEQIVWIPSGLSPAYKIFYTHSSEADKFEPILIKDKVWSAHKNSLTASLASQFQNHQLLVFPVRKNGVSLGLIVGIIDTEKLITSATQESDLHNFKIEFTDMTTHKSSLWRNDSFSNVTKQFSDSLMIHPSTFPVLNHEWKLEVATSRIDLYKGLPAAMVLNLFFGLVFSFLVSALHLLLYLRVNNTEKTPA